MKNTVVILDEFRSDEPTQEFTEIGKSYWSDNGVYTKEYNKLYEDLVPSSGNSETLNGELIRAISRLGHEYNNNGNCNSRVIETYLEEETCSNCSGEGEVEGFDCDDDGNYLMEDCSECCSGYVEEEYNCDPEIDGFYNTFLDLIEGNVPNTEIECDDVKAVITHPFDCNFSDKEQHKYDRLFDKVIFYVLTNEDKVIPEWYDN